MTTIEYNEFGEEIGVPEHATEYANEVRNWNAEESYQRSLYDLPVFGWAWKGDAAVLERN